MSDSSAGIDAKALLYSVLERLGRDNLRMEMAGDSRGAISRVLRSCMDGLRGSGASDAGTLQTLVTALMHYLLTECMIQSERKIALDGEVLDIVIPSMRMLRVNPDGALVILIARGDDGLLAHRLERVYTLQPERRNVWAVLGTGGVDYSSVGGVRIYLPDEYAYPPARPLSSIIEDIRGFMDSKGIRPFKIVA